MRWIVVPLAFALAPAAALHAASLDRLSYVLVTGDGSSTMSGSSEDFERFEALRTGKTPLLFVSDHGAAYVIRDPGLLHRAEAIMRPQQELGHRQGELGRMQGDLGRAQGALGAEQGRLGAQMADTTPRHMGDLGAKQAALGRQQSALGARQADLGRQQAELGRQQARLAEQAKPQFQALVAEAIKRGLAQRVN